MREIAAMLGDQRVFIDTYDDDRPLKLRIAGPTTFHIGGDGDEWEDFVREVALLLYAVTGGAYTDGER